MRFPPALVLVFLSLLVACGGGGGGGGGGSVTPPTTAAPVATPTPVPTTAPVSIAVGASPTTAPLGSVAGESATLGLPAASSGSGSASAQLSLSAPGGAPTVQSSTRLPRAIGATQLTSLLFISLTSSVTLTFPTTPSFTFAFPAGFALASGTQAYIAIYDPTQPGAGWQPFAGPGTVNGTTVSFAPIARSLTFQANQTYFFVLFTTGTVIGVPTAAPSPTPTPTPTPTPKPTASPTLTPSPSPSPTGTAASAFACPVSAGTAAVARGSAGSAADTVRRNARRHGNVPATAGVLEVTYDRSLAQSSSRSIAARESQLGANLVQSYDLPHTNRVVRVIAVPAGQAASAAALLRSQSGVRSVSQAGGRRYASTSSAYFPPPSDPYFAGFTGGTYLESASTPGQWDMHAIGLEHAFGYSQATNSLAQAFPNALGSPAVKIAIIDTGEDTLHPELAGGKVVGQGCFITNTNNVQSTSAFTTDPNGHGTDVSGIAAASLGNGLGFAGAGGNVSIVGYRVFPTPDNNCLNEGSRDPTCGADTRDIAAAIVDAVQNQHVNVISMSLGGGGCVNGVDDDSVEGAAVAEAIAANVIVVVASGNGGVQSIDAPACDNGVIAVGASALADGQLNGAGNSNGSTNNPTEYVASYSNYGSPGANVQNSAAWGIVAPGGDPSSSSDNDDLHWIENIWTATPFTGADAGSCAPDFGGGTITDCRILIAGTSMATPHVAGAAALILSVNSGYQSASAMKTLLCQTADNISDSRQGCGRLNVYRAMAHALNDPSPP